MEVKNPNQVDILSAWGFGRMIYVQMALRAAIELKLFDIIASSGLEAKLSCAQILSKIPTENPNATIPLERILRMLGVNSILAMSSRQCENDNSQTEITYGLTREAHCFVTNGNGVTGSPLVLFHSEKENIECLYLLKDAVLKPNNLPLYKAYHGRTFFEDASKKPELSLAFNNTLSFVAKILAQGILLTYEGFEGVTELMDVGGNTGGIIQMIVNCYPDIRGINFDLPHIIADAPNYPGVEHISGDMFQSLPKAQTIFLKSVLHDWNDDQCIKILQNCYKALPDTGKVIIVELILPEVIDNSEESATVVTLDFVMLVHQDGKERTLGEFEVLAKTAGFKEIKAFHVGGGFHVLEFIKDNAM